MSCHRAFSAPRAASLRAEIDRLTREAETWERGAVGQRQIGGVLDHLETEGYSVIHDRRVPGGKVNVDHIVIGPTGVTVIDTKNYRWPVTESKGELWTATTPLRRKLETVVYESAAVERALAGFLIPLGMRVAHRHVRPRTASDRARGVVARCPRRGGH
jgi:hypothetical protein